MFLYKLIHQVSLHFLKYSKIHSEILKLQNYEWKCQTRRPFFIVLSNYISCTIFVTFFVKWFWHFQYIFYFASVVSSHVSTDVHLRTSKRILFCVSLYIFCWFLFLLWDCEGNCKRLHEFFSLRGSFVENVWKYLAVVPLRCTKSL